MAVKEALNATLDVKQAAADVKYNLKASEDVKKSAKANMDFDKAMKSAKTSKKPCWQPGMSSRQPRTYQRPLQDTWWTWTTRWTWTT